MRSCLKNNENKKSFSQRISQWMKLGQREGTVDGVSPSLPSPNNNEQEWDLEAEQGRVDMTGSGEELIPEEWFSGESKGPLFPSSPLLLLKANSGLGLCLSPAIEQSQQHSKGCEVNLHPREGLVAMCSSTATVKSLAFGECKIRSCRASGASRSPR